MLKYTLLNTNSHFQTQNCIIVNNFCCKFFSKHLYPFPNAENIKLGKQDRIYFVFLYFKEILEETKVDNTAGSQHYVIDIEKVIASKDEKLLKRMPRFIINYLKRIIHQDELNDFISKNHDKKPLEFVDAGLEMFQVKIEVKGVENLKVDPRCIIAANHPLGGLDGVGLTKVIAENLDRSVMITANDLLMNLKTMQPAFLGVNKHGQNAKDSISEMHRSFEADCPIIFFPAGLISRRIKGKIIDLEWKRTFIKKAVEYKRDVIPVHINGRVSGFFYRLANFRKFIGLKQNIEMLYLPNELFKQRNQKLIMTIGKPIPWETFSSDKKPEHWAQKVKDMVYLLGEKM